MRTNPQYRWLTEEDPYEVAVTEALQSISESLERLAEMLQAALDEPPEVLDR